MILYYNSEIKKVENNSTNEKKEDNTNTNNTNTNNYKKIGIGIGLPVGILAIYKIVKYISDSKDNNKINSSENNRQEEKRIPVESNKSDDSYQPSQKAIKARQRYEEIQREKLERSQKIIETYGKDVTIDGLYSAINEFLLSLHGFKLTSNSTILNHATFGDNEKLKTSFKKLYIIGILIFYYNPTLGTFKEVSTYDSEQIETIIDWNINSEHTLSHKFNGLTSELIGIINNAIIDKKYNKDSINLDNKYLQDLVKILFHNSEISEDLLGQYSNSQDRPEYLIFAIDLINTLKTMECKGNTIKFSNNKKLFYLNNTNKLKKSNSQTLKEKQAIIMEYYNKNIQSLLDTINLYESSKNPPIDKLDQLKNSLTTKQELLKLKFENKNFKKDEITNSINEYSSHGYYNSTIATLITHYPKLQEDQDNLTEYTKKHMDIFNEFNSGKLDD